MKLTFLGKVSDQGDSPTLYRTDRGTFIVQGWKVTDPEALVAMKIPDHEGCVEIPPELARYFVGWEEIATP